jgi:hypothetical protein
MKRFFLAALALFVFTASALAQGTTGRLVGVVSGPDGVIPNATITIRDNATNREITVTASEDGSFSTPLEFGTYTVTISAPGFATFTATELKIDAGREYSLNPTLTVGAVTDQVTVVAGADVINSASGELSNTVSPRQVRELPINGRNPLALLNLIAGANPQTGSINGQRSSSVNYTRDGINVQDNFIRNGFVSDQPTVDDTGEFTVITQNAGAEYGSGSTQVQLVTPRGGSEFHGNLFAFNRNSRFAANPFFNNINNTPRPFLNRNQFGGTISGPANLPRFGEGGPGWVSGKGFFFFNYEGFRLANQVPASATTLLAPARNGTFTYIDNAGTQRTINVLTGAGLNLAGTNLTSFNAAGGALAVDPLIVSRFLDPAPLTGNGTLTGINLLQTVNFNRANPEDRNAVTGRFDIDFNDRNTFNFVYKWNKNADARTDIAAGFSPGTFNTQGGPTTLYVAAYRMTPTPNFSNEIRGGYQRSEPFFTSTTDPRDLPFLLSIPLITNAEPSFQSQGRNTSYWNIQDNASYTVGNHAIRFGGQAQVYRLHPVNFVGSTPTFTIGGGGTATPTLPAALFPGGINTTDLGRANSLRFLLGGVVGSGSQTVNAISQNSGFIAGEPQRRVLEFENYALYIADQWRVGPTLTLNFGLRYELYTPLRDPRGLFLEPRIPNGVDPISAILNPIGDFQFVGGNAGSPGNFFRADKGNFGPNVSFAWSPNFGNSFLGNLFPGEGRTVFRGGFRVNYVNDEYVRSADNALLNNQGLGSGTALARLGGTDTGASLFRVIGIGNVQTQAPIVVPPSQFGPTPTGRTFAQNNALSSPPNFGTISLIDPNLQVQRNYEYSVGFQREIGFQSAIEIRYVGGYSNELTRSIDFNQVNIRDNGFLADFNRARANLATFGSAGCTAAQAASTGCQQLTVFPNLGSGGLLTNATVISNIQNGTPADLAIIYIQNGLAGTVPFLANPNAGVVNLLTNGGEYNYNALQAEFRRRFTDGLSLQANYTFQKILSDVTAGDEFNQTRVEPFLDNANPRLDYARTSYDRTHTFNFNGIYELPFGRGRRFLNEGRFLDLLVGGFQFSSIVNVSSGQPFGIYDARGTLNRAARSGFQSATSLVPGDQIRDLIGIFRTPNGVFFINPSVLQATATRVAGAPTTLPASIIVNLNEPIPANYVLTSVRGASPVGTAPFSGQVVTQNAPGSTGNLQRNFLNGPIFINWDAGLIKNIRVTENTRIQLRMEVFNVMNRANFFVGSGTANFDVNSSNFGRVTSTFSPRIVQFGARFEF